MLKYGEFTGLGDVWGEGWEFLFCEGEFTGLGDVWGEGWEFLFCEVEKGRLKMGFRRPFCEMCI
ncbi:alpha-amylase [Neisseria gonorrhoeae]